MIMIATILGIIISLVILIFIIITLILSIKVVKQAEFAIVTRFGKYHRTLNNGINFIIPFIDRIAKNENYKEKVLDFPEQDIITKDNATIKVDTVIYLKITDPKLFTYGAENSMLAIENLSATTLRNLLGELDLDQTLTSRDAINSKLTIILDEASDAWGIKVHRVEIKNIIPPSEIQKSMEKQMRAEREKRASILEAEGKKQAAILVAEGEKEAKILQAQANKEAQILLAQAKKESEILEAEGKKQAIDTLNNTDLNNQILTLKAIEQLKEVANGQATKIFLPNNLTTLANTVSLAGELFDKDKSNT
ncbi:SPFH/Band 7/PHB domain protein [Mycoplasmopsis phocirhinis]|uniref:SPFH/Band 7/PHB domain protein n=2 Tax=Mycoplasmopsis phocirhinis TaxID=142650 RepID=A0A4P6MP65_9BACT|nr:SPFH/Band 7/PHB domain protein [Mycoplasmopsis phocirhinis]